MSLLGNLRALMGDLPDDALACPPPEPPPVDPGTAPAARRTSTPPSSVHSSEDGARRLDA
ncbi:hypothetical protein GCM10023200_36340 [Actinomycetospora chlora]|uniref:Uncharacterized protein n=1 Tax=Actinomycetospora chlora TaxID=663608 RepID=A0ABP9BKH1_9PSEU